MADGDDGRAKPRSIESQSRTRAPIVEVEASGIVIEFRPLRPVRHSQGNGDTVPGEPVGHTNVGTAMRSRLLLRHPGHPVLNVYARSRRDRTERRAFSTTLSSHWTASKAHRSRAVCQRDRRPRKHATAHQTLTSHIDSPVARSAFVDNPGHSTRCKWRNSTSRGGLRTRVLRDFKPGICEVNTRLDRKRGMWKRLPWIVSKGRS